MKTDISKILFCVFRHPLATVVLTVVFFVSCLCILPGLSIDNSVEVFFNKQGRAYQSFQEWKEVFGTDDLVILALDFSEGVFRQSSLKLIKELTDSFDTMPLIDHVTSLTTVNVTRGQGQDFIVEKLIEEVPDTRKALNGLRKETLADPLYVKNIVSQDGHVAAIVLELDAGVGDKQKRAVFDEIQYITETSIPQDIPFYLSGLATVEHFYARYMQEDFKAFMPFLLAMIVCIMALCFRSTKLVIVSMASILVSVTGAMALLKLFGFSVNNVTTIIPPILMAVMIADSVHVIGESLSRHHQMSAHQDSREVLHETLSHLALPCLLTTATTAVGFLSLTVSAIEPVRQLGLVVGISVFIALVVTFTGFPAAAVLMHAFSRSSSRQSSQGPNRMESLLKGMGDFTVRFRKPILIVACIVALGSLFAARKIKAETSVIEYFRSNTPVYQATTFIEKHLSGVHTLNVSLKADRQGFFYDPTQLERIESLTQFLTTLKEVDKVSSINDYLKEINASFHNENRAFYRIPETSDMTAQFALLYGREDLQDFVDEDWQWVTVRIRLNEHSTVKLEGVINQIQSYVDKNFQDLRAADVLGQTALEVESNNTVADGQKQSLLLAMIVIFGMMFCVFRSVSLGLISIIPNALPILMNFGIMGIFGIRLDSATSMIAAVGIGIVVDDTIHFLHGYAERLKQGRDHTQAMYDVLLAKGRPIIVTSLILFFGFGVLAVSKFMPTAYFGMLTALLMLNALVCDLIVLPAVLITVKPYVKGENHVNS